MKLSGLSLIWLIVFSALIAQAGTFSAFATQTAPIDAPTGLSVTPISDSSLKLTWMPPTDNGGSTITKYQINRNDTLPIFTFSNATIFIDKHILPAHLETYTVAALNSIGLGPFSVPASGTTQSGVGSNSNNLGQQVSDLVHARNELIKEQRQKIIALIHDCQTQVKNASPADKKSIRETCNAKIHESNQAFKELQSKLNEQIKTLKSQSNFQTHKADKNINNQNGTSHIGNNVIHSEKKLNHLKKQSKGHGNSENHQ